MIFGSRRNASKSRCGSMPLLLLPPITDITHRTCGSRISALNSSARARGEAERYPSLAPVSCPATSR